MQVRLRLIWFVLNGTELTKATIRRGHLVLFVRIRFCTPTHLQRHIDAVHKGIKHPCPYRKYETAYKSDLIRHISRHHTPAQLKEYLANKVDGRSTKATKHERSFVCKHCGNGFTSNRHLKDHLKNVHREKVCINN